MTTTADHITDLLIMYYIKLHFTRDQFFVANFSKFLRPLCQIPRLTAANFPHIAINFLQPLKLTKYAVFVAGKLPQLTDTVCLPNKQAIFQISSIFSIFLTLELEWQSCI